MRRLAYVASLVLFGVWLRGQVSTTNRKAPSTNTPSPLANALSRGFSAADIDTAIHNPDQFSWIMFARLNRIAPTQATVNGKQTNSAIWETWADDSRTYPADPDPKSPPQWPAGGVTVPMTIMATPSGLTAPPELKVLTPSVKQEIRRMQRAAATARNVPVAANVAIEVPANPNQLQETRRNKETFDFIVNNGLYYRQGLASRFQNPLPIVFPTGSVEIKADWIVIQESDKARFHWNYDANGNLYGLVALHILTKALPNWTWTTFEWVDNSGRCDFIGCHDTFGFTPGDIPPNPQLGGQYATGTMTGDLKSLLQSAGVPVEFSNYRLKGSQNDFTTSDGRVTLLGNSVTESGFVQTSSCVTCHANAAFDSVGAPNPTIGFTPDQQSTNGAPNPSWFFNTSTTPWTRKYMQHDFVWGLLRARPARNKP
jgi:hypothetical protein